MNLDVDDRGQIVLVGAVAIAFIVIGLVLVANTVLFTESVGSQASLSDVDRASATEKRVQTDAASLTYRVNRLNNFDSQAGLNGSLAANLSTYANLTGTVQFQQRGVLQNVTWNRSSSEYGVRIEQDDTRTFNNSGPPNWSPVSSPANVSDFQATFNISGMTEPTLATDPVFSVSYTGDGGTTHTIYFAKDDGNLSVSESYGSLSDVLSPPTECDEIPANPRVLVDISNGSVPGTSCTFPGLDSVSHPVTITFDDSTAAWGQYSFVADDTGLSSQYSSHTGSDSDSPYYSYVLWAVGLDFEYQGPEATYRTTNTVPIYGNASRAAP